jgi:hypothetical protein
VLEGTSGDAEGMSFSFGKTARIPQWICSIHS